ncbi:MAG: hypothetical protein JSW50_14585 [Candidatus Latescibacterota bacterium]|nr:MAG: hypothetical protein JSW50_14585 [Candidatus Latescibacterota bacterium]
MFYVIGLFIGFFFFGATVDRFWQFYNTSGFFGRLTLPEWLDLSTGVVVFLVIVMAVGMFWAGEKLEKIFTTRRNGVS